MSFTNSTPNYGLPQWIAADKPKFLTDINNAYSTIDTQLKNANDTANTAADNATSALSIAGQAATTAEGAATVAGQAAALAQSVNELVGTLNAKMGTTSIATIGDGTVTGAIDALNTTNSGLNTRITALEGKYTTEDNSVSVSSAGYNLVTQITGKGDLIAAVCTGVGAVMDTYVDSSGGIASLYAKFTDNTGNPYPTSTSVNVRLTYKN